jgi:hypothetical protein
LGALVVLQWFVLAMLLRLSGRVSRLFRAGRSLNAKEKAIHDKGLVSTLKQTHDDLDIAVLEAYGWQDLANRGAVRRDHTPVVQANAWPQPRAKRFPWTPHSSHHKGVVAPSCSGFPQNHISVSSGSGPRTGNRFPGCEGSGTLNRSRRQ